MIRHLKKAEVDPVLGVHTASGCVGHRCDEHEDLPPMNQTGPDGSECGGCVGQAFAEAYEKAFEKKVFWPLIQSARDRLNLLAPGAGDAFQEEARATINTASISGGDDE
jgi:hypothetical protein